MSQIEISCIGSIAVFTNTPDIFSGGNVDTVKFYFNEDWNGYNTKTAVFYTNPKETSLQVLDSHDVAVIPAEMLAKKCKLSIGVIGTNASGGIKTSKILTYLVNQGAVITDMEITAPTPDIWLQILSIVAEQNKIVNDNKSLVENIQLIVDESQIENKANKDLSNVSNADWITKLTSLSVGRIEIGSYTATNTYGESSKNSLTFGFVPKMVAVVCNDCRGVSTGNGAFIWIASMTGGGDLGYLQSSSYVSDRVFTFSGGKTLQWYAKDARNQCNYSNYKYYYCAIG